MSRDQTPSPLVLVADDDPDILALVRFRLEREGCDVVCAPDGQTALELALDRTRRLREHEPTKAMPIILLTARVGESDLEHGFEMGADDYVTKPFSPQMLRERVQAALGFRTGP
jgi:DNA-binding response OmpR family regulator